MSAKSQRLGRIEGEMQRVLSTLVSREVRDPRVGNVTITTVSVAPDMSTARIFFVPFASKHTPEEVTEGLNRASGFLRGAIGRALLAVGLEVGDVMLVSSGALSTRLLGSS